MENVKLKALQKLIKLLEREQTKAKEKAKKEREKISQKYIVFKDIECYTHEDIDDVYRYDGCTSSECDRAHERLDKKLRTNFNGETEAEIYLDYLQGILSQLYEERAVEEFNSLPLEEQTKRLEKRNREAGLQVD